MGAYVGPASIGMSLASGVAGAFEARSAEKRRLQALNLRMKQIEDSTEQESIMDMRKLNHILASQNAVQAARGGGTAGLTSANMISLSDINQFAENENAIQLSKIFQEEGVYGQEMSAIKESQSQEISSVTGGITNALSTAANIYVPRGTSSISQEYTPQASDTILSSSLATQSSDLGLQLPRIDMLEI